MITLPTACYVFNKLSFFIFAKCGNVIILHTACFVLNEKSFCMFTTLSYVIILQSACYLFNKFSFFIFAKCRNVIINRWLNNKTYKLFTYLFHKELASVHICTATTHSTIWAAGKKCNNGEPSYPYPIS